MPKENNDAAKWEWLATQAMFALINKGDEFNADSFFAECRKAQIPAKLIGQFSGALFKSFKASGYIRKTKLFTLSTRNGSSPLPTYVPVKR